MYAAKNESLQYILRTAESTLSSLCSPNLALSFASPVLNAKLKSCYTFSWTLESMISWSYSPDAVVSFSKEPSFDHSFLVPYAVLLRILLRARHTHAVLRSNHALPPYCLRHRSALSTFALIVSFCTISLYQSPDFLFLLSLTLSRCLSDPDSSTLSSTLPLWPVSAISRT